MARRPGSKPPRGPVVDDMALFRHVMRDVEPLRRSPAPEVSPRPEKPPPEARPPSEAKSLSEAKSQWETKSPRTTAAPPPATPVHTPSGGVDRRTKVRLRRGQIRPEARLDLHGMTQIEAHAALASFIRGARASGFRCVLIVTGKGSMLTGGVLRREVPRWLEEPRLRGAVLDASEAHAKDGGAGALYVLLRRKT